jgi:hypothetical protein
LRILELRHEFSEKGLQLRMRTNYRGNFDTVAFEGIKESKKKVLHPLGPPKRLIEKEW